MESGAWILMSVAYYIISVIVWFAVEGDSVCLVAPTAVAFIAGDNVSLNCTDSNFVSGWKRGSDYNSGSNVFQAASPGSSDQVPQMLVYGYSVDRSDNGRQVVLIMNNISTVQADRYYCSCYPSSFAATNVTVLVSKPTFSTTSQITDGGPVNIMCSISFNGTADASVKITNISGQMVAEKRQGGTYPSNSKDLHVINLEYSTIANSSFNQTYSCQINLTNNSTQIYSEQMMTSVHWVSVRNVQINPVDKTRCSSGSQCAINQAVNCAAEGNPYPVQFQWTGFLNGSQFNKITSGLFTLASTGNCTVQCTAFNMIGGFTYNNTSEYFKTEVTVEGPPIAQPDTTMPHSNIPLIVGVVVGVGGGIIVIVLAIVIFLFCKRKKIEQNKAEVYTTLDVHRSELSEMPPQEMYTELQISPVEHELQNDHRAAVENYETRLDFSGDN